MYQIPRVKVNFAILLFLCCSLLFLTLCGKPDGPSSQVSNTISVTPHQSPLTDNKPHILNELFTALKDPVISVLEIDANNDGSKDILLTTAENEIYALVNQNGGIYIAKTLLSNQSINQSPESINTASKDNSPAQGKLNKDDADNGPPAHEPILISTETADINNDGYDDIILAYAGTENAPLKLLCGNSIGMYDDLSTALLPSLDIPAPIMAKSADVNSDGLADIIITSFGKTKVDPYDVKAIDPRKNYLLINSGTGAFTDETVNLFGEDFAYTSGIDIQVANFNGDGQNELVLIKPDGNLLYENVDGKFLSSSYYETVTPQPVQNRTITVDADNNGSQDTIAIVNGAPVIIYDAPNALQKPAGLQTQDSGLQTSYISPFQYKISGPGGRDMAGIRQIGDIIYFEFDSITAAYVWGNILLNFDTARLKCVSIEEDPNNWHGFWVWWTLATSMPEYGGEGIPYYYDSTGKGSNRAKTWASWYGPETAGPAGSYDNESGKIWLYTSTLAGYSYTSPLRIGFEVLQTGPVNFTAQSNDFTAYDFHNVDAGTVSTVNIVQQDNCATNEDLLNNARVRICGPDQADIGQRFTINVLGQTINPVYSLGNNVYSVEFYENDVLLYRKGFNWGEEQAC
ncbi:MAG: VCBS repeat-containing protein [Planctomycetes bacterium]|nr:VCBS repeat-containing protein [Planctomycetota bacterium]